MTVPSTDPIEAVFAGDGTANALQITWRFLSGSDLVVTQIVDGIEDPTPLERGVDFTVTGTGAEGGTIIPAAVRPIGTDWRVRRSTPRGQPSSFPSDSYSAKQHEQAHDRLAMIIQEQDAEILRGPKVPRGEAGPEMDSVADLEGKFVAVAGGRMVGLEADIPQAESSAARSLSSANASGLSQVAAENAEDAAQIYELGAEAARDAAEAFRDAAITGKGLFASTAHAVGNGVIGHGAITGGSGGTNGTFVGTATGGTAVIPAQITFTVAGGAVTSIAIVKPGYYTAAPTGFDFSASSGLTGASAAPVIGANTVDGEHFHIPSASGDGYVDLHKNNAGAASAKIATLPNKTKLDSLGPDRIAAAVDGNGWLAADALTLTGAAAGLTWSATHLAIAEAIKEVEVIAASAKNAEDWYIGTLANADATFKDLIIVRRASDNAVVFNSGNITWHRRPDGLGEVVGVAAGVYVRMVIDYSSLATGLLINSATPTPLLIAKKNGVSQVGNRALLEASPNWPWRNLFPNGNFDTERGMSNTGSGVFASPPSSKAMQRANIKRALRVGTNGTGSIFPDSGAIFTSEDNSASRWLFMGAWCYSSNGATWPNIGGYIYPATGNFYTSKTLTNYIEVDANTRFYFWLGQFPLPTNPSDIVGGKVRLGQQSDQTASGVELQFGGLVVMTADRPLHLSNTRKDDWYPEIDNSTALGDLAGALASAGAAFAGKTIVFLGDSIMDDYGVPEAVGTKLGATIKNFGWEGTRLSKRSSGNYQSRDGVSIAEAVAAADFSQLVADVNSQYSTASDYHVAKRATAAEMAAFDWSSADVIVCAWGTNDYSGSVQLGASTSATPGEFNGGINEFIRIMQTALPAAEIVFCTPAYRAPGGGNPDSETSTNANGVMLQAFVDAIKDRAEKRGHQPVIDLHKTLGINAYNWTQFYGDYVHPNSSTGKDRWASRIAAGLEGVIR